MMKKAEEISLGLYYLTFAFTSLLAVLILASQNAPLYLALTSVPTVRYGGSSSV